MALPEPTEPLLPRQQQDCGPRLDDAPDRRCRSATWITALGSLLVTANFVVAVYSSQGYGVAFCSCFYLLAIVNCLDRYEKEEPGSELRGRQKLSVGLFMTSLGFVFWSQVSMVTPPAVTVAVCLLAFGIVARAIYYL